MMNVIYAEKPSVARTIADSLGHFIKRDGYLEGNVGGIQTTITWGFGHLCGLARETDYDPTYRNWRKMPLPLIPEKYKIVLKKADGVSSQYMVVKELFKEASLIICATDFDREGELIFDYLYRYMGCAKPVKRMKLSSMTKGGIQSAYASLLERSDFKGLIESARCRSIADWVVGCNMTVAMTLRTGTKSVFPIGRVQTPTLKMVVDRDLEIENFKPSDFFTVEADFTTKDGASYHGAYVGKRFEKNEDAEAVLASCKGKSGIVSSVERTEKKKSVPGLYSLGLLQIEANKRFGYGVAKTLSIVQSLYEKGLLTYPRTDSQFLPEDMLPKMGAIFSALTGYEGMIKGGSIKNMEAHKKKFFDDSKVGAHFAIVPTEKSVSGLLPKEEKNIYDLAAFSVIRMLYPDAVLESTKVLTDVGENSFVTYGTAVKEAGWMAVDGNPKDGSLPRLVKNQTVAADVHVLKKQTEPPKHYTEASLLSAMLTAGKNIDDDDLRSFMLGMDNKGIGTEATRAATIQGLLARGFLTEQKKTVLSTQAGRWLIRSIPVPDVESVTLTAKMEKQLDDIVTGKQDSEAFLAEIYGHVREWVKDIMEDKTMDTDVVNKEESGITCPVCGRPMHKFDWGYGCTGYKDGCKFAIGRIAGKKLTDSQVKTLIEKKRLNGVSGFMSKAGKNFSANLVLEPESGPDGKPVDYKVKFDLGSGNNTDLKCPVCGKPMHKYGWGYGCTGYKDGCRFSIGKIAGKTLSDGQVKTLIETKRLDDVPGFISRTGKEFTASLVLDPEMGENGETTNYKIKFELGDNGDNTDLKCPACGRPLHKFSWGYGCTGYKDGCRFSIGKIAGKMLSDAQIKMLIEGKELSKIEGFKSRSGKEFSAGLKLATDVDDEGETVYRVEFLFDK